MDKMEENKKELYDALVKSYNTNKDLFHTYGEVLSLKRGHDDKDKDQDPFAGSDRWTKRRKSSKEAKSSKDSSSKEDRPGHQVIPQDDFINNDLEYLKGGRLSRRYSTLVTKTKAAAYEIKWIEDMTYCYSKEGGRSSIRCRKYQKKLNLTRLDTFRSDLRKRTAYTAYSDPQGTALHDITSGIRMGYLSKKKWNRLDNQRARVMIQNIDKLLFKKRLMRNLENFVGGREYGNDLRPPQKWISTIAKECCKARQPPRTFDELMRTPIDFSAYVMNHLKIDKLTQEILVGPAFNMLKGTCKSSVKFKYHFEECYKAVNNRLDWHNPKGRKYPFDLSKLLPLIEDRGHQVVPTDYFIKNDIEYLKGGSSSSKYVTSTTITKAAKYDNIEGIEDTTPTL
nr:hypothetical protein [Tanacetum cinerariifolium]